MMGFCPRSGEIATNFGADHLSQAVFEQFLGGAITI